MDAYLAQAHLETARDRLDNWDEELKPRLQVESLMYSVRNLMFVLEWLVTTAAPTTTAPTADSPSGAAEASTSPKTEASPLSVHFDMSNGPVAPNSNCAQGRHNWGDLSPAFDAMLMAAERGLTEQTMQPICDSCGVSLLFARTHAQVVPPT